MSLHHLENICVYRATVLVLSISHERRIRTAQQLQSAAAVLVPSQSKSNAEATRIGTAVN